MSKNNLEEKITIQQLITESNSMFQERLKYIDKIKNYSMKNNSNINMKDTIRYSVLWHYITFLNCKYDPSIYNKIKMFEK